VNILFVDQFSEPGGAQQCLMDLLPEVRARGWGARLLAPGEGELVQRCREAGVPVHPLPLGSYSSGGKNALDMVRYGIEIPRMRRALREVIAQHPVDLVHINGPRTLPAAWNIDRPVAFHAHSPVAGTLPRRMAEVSVRRSRAAVIAVSKFVARRYPGARVIYNGMPDHSGPGRVFSGRPARIGIVGRIAPEKGHLDFMRAARVVAETFSDARFFIYGERLFSAAAYDRKLRQAARDFPVEFCGWKSDAGAVMRDLDVLVVPSDPSEATPRVIMEALSAGTPVVAYRCGGIPELLEDGRTGLLVEWSDVDALSRTLLSLIGAPGLREQLSLAGRSEWARRFRIENYRTRVCDALAEIERGEPQATSAVAGEDELAGLGAPGRG
jgi:glycosyltransferase involved in cell wall biosynthesis